MADILDISHVFFLETIKSSKKIMGAPVATGQLIRKAMAMSDKIPEVKYNNMDEYEKSVKEKTNPLTQLEGESIRHEGDIFTLSKCPFAQSIKSYIDLFGGLPEDYKEITEDFNKTSTIKDHLHVGEGAGVSPFCAIHQPLRSSVASKKIKIGGKSIEVYQLGCKSGSGYKGFAEKWIEKTGISKEKVDELLDNAMCCYCIRIKEW